MGKLLFISLLVTSFGLQAAETDQYYASKAIIRDSSNEMNGFFHERIQVALDKVNEKRQAISCRLVAKEVLTQVLGEFSVVDYAKSRSFSKVSVFTQKSPLVDRYPDESVSESDYRATSVYRNRPFPLNVVGVARTLNINGIYIGTDKLGHFSIVGKAYYTNFLEALDKGMTEDEALNEAMRKGYNQEIAILGYTIGGTLSFADLEANYQGYLFGRNMCDGENPYLVKKNDMWIQNPANIFDIRKYVNPKYDEAYNPNFWNGRVWKHMEGEIVVAHCKNSIEPAYLARVAYYKTIEKQSYNDVYLEKFLTTKGKYDRNKQLLSKNVKCSDYL